MTLDSNSTHTPTLAIFCKVVDNFGDIGICWRLARQLHGEHGVEVTLWVDDLRSFQRIWPAVAVDAARQRVEGVLVRHWTGQDGDADPAEIPDIVIEFFGVELPPAYVAAMARREPRPVWINYEGLSAEAWVEGCHTLPSMHPRLKLTKHFFFPGFNDKTGGLLRERGLMARRAAFQADAAARDGFLGRLGVAGDELDALTVSLFCYPHAPVAELFDAWARGARRVTCLVPEGVARAQVAAFLRAGAQPGAGSATDADAGADADPDVDADARAGAHATRGALTVRVIPFLRQDDYDRLLWACDLNFVRGEDSWVRAQWAARPFVWHIYPQDENLHHVKLRAFLDIGAGGPPSLGAFALAWNGASQDQDWPALWTAVQADMPALAHHADAWQARLSAHGDLVSNLLRFARSLR